MKSVNSNKDAGCTPLSSNCVIWQGPCLDCISVNTGDTISDVVFELATELCTLKEQLDLTDLDLKCLIDCPSCPEPDKDLINVLQLIITRLCLLDPNPLEPVVPEEVVVNIAPCFQYVDNNGDIITSLKVSEYVKLIGLKVCELKTAVDQHTATLSNHETRITTLENASHVVVLPKVTPSCVVTPAVPTDMDIVLEALEEQFCNLRTVTGIPTALSQSIANQCPNLNSAPALSTGGTMSGIPGWKTSVSTVADSLTNLWLTICDMRAAVVGVQQCCQTSCTDIIVEFLATIVDNGATIRIFFSGYSSIPAGFTDCNPTGSVMNISDGLGGSYNINIQIPTASTDPAPITINVADTPLSNSGTFTFTLASCLTNGTLTCNKTIINTASVPQAVCSIPTNVSATITA